MPTPWLHDAPVPRPPRYDTLDFWRGIACLAVVVHHSVLTYLRLDDPTPSRAMSLLQIMEWGWIGVPVFFVISGYCIAATADRTRRTGDGITKYFYRRFRRIYPPLWTVTFLSVVFFLVVDVVLWPRLLSTEPWPQIRPWWFSTSQWFGNLTLTETWRHYVFGSPRMHFPRQDWTLCYEEQFYLVVGLLLLRPRYFFSGAIAVTVLTLGAMVMVAKAGWTIEGFFFDGNWLMFAAGILVYYSTNYGGRVHQVLSTMLLAACAIPQTTLHGGGIAFAFGAALIALKPFDRAMASSILARPILFCGQMCYSLYLVHLVLVCAVASLMLRAGLNTAGTTLFVTVPLCVLASVLVGRATFMLVERRFLNRRPADLSTQSAPVALRFTSV